jgi:hypothetical protein
MELDPLTILTATGVAGYVALIADWVASNRFGLSTYKFAGRRLLRRRSSGFGSLRIWSAVDSASRNDSPLTSKILFQSD